MKFGSAFSENISRGRSEKPLFRSKEPSWWSGFGRFLLFTCVFFLFMFILLWRLFDLTVVRGHQYRKLADGNRTRELVLHAPRGILYDRTGKPLVSNIAEYRLLKPCEGDKQLQECITRISQEEGERLRNGGLPPGYFLEVDYERMYLYPEATAHVVGYVNELSEEELQKDYFSLRGYKRGDRVGRIGAEEVFEDRLRGRDGKELVEVDATGAILRVLGRDPAMPGEDIALSIDASLSEIVRASYPVGKKGAVIVAKPDTGEILSLFSSPSFSPSKFSLGMTQQEFERLMNDSDKPMFNRAIGGVYPPGSTFKLVTALAGFQEGVIKNDTVVEDVGVITIGPFTFPNWYFKQYGKTDGMVNLVKAIQRSNDIFFYKIGEWLGISKISSWARLVGIGSPLGIELSGEASGLMPDPQWKNSVFQTPQDLEARNNEWYLGDTYHVAIGQGYLLTTPLQVNGWTNVIANGGNVCVPTIKKIEKQRGRTAQCRSLHIGKHTIDQITEGMREACAVGGTGWPLFHFSVQLEASGAARLEVPVACKTGTAEYGDIQNRTHAWFTVFAPLLDTTGDETGVIHGEPEVSVTVLVEEAGEGSDKAAPIAKNILEAWFKR